MNSREPFGLAETPTSPASVATAGQDAQQHATPTAQGTAPAPGEPILRVARPDDLDALVALDRDMFPLDAWSRGAWRAELTRPRTRYWVIERGGRLLGAVGILVGGDEADVQTIAVRPEVRRQGWATRLLREGLRYAVANGARRAFLEVRESAVAAQALYARFGFSEIGRRPNYYPGDRETAIVMRADLPDDAAEADRLHEVLAGACHETEPHRAAPVDASDAVDATAVSRCARPAAIPGQEPDGAAAHEQNAAPAPNSVPEPDAAPAPAPQHPAPQPGANREPVVLGIETSCDETGVGIVRGTTLLANAVASSMDEHAKYGGVVPEVAARAHAEAIVPVLREALAQARVTLDDIDAIAVTAGPGLAGALMVGVGAAKALATATGKPLYGANHLIGHVAADLLREDVPPVEFPAVALLVSGGHTSLIRVDSLAAGAELLGETIDDAAGEAFDKVARLLGLPYPGGPHIDRAAVGGDPAAFRFPRGLARADNQHRYDFSFSGLKTAVAREVERFEDAGEPVPVADIAASFRESVADVLVSKAVTACVDLGIPRLLLGGGVAANARIREALRERAAAEGIRLHVPPLPLCTDNGAMIAAAGAQLVAAGAPPSPPDFAADSTLPMSTVVAGAPEENA